MVERSSQLRCRVQRDATGEEGAAGREAADHARVTLNVTLADRSLITAVRLTVDTGSADTDLFSLTKPGRKLRMACAESSP